MTKIYLAKEMIELGSLKYANTIWKKYKKKLFVKK